MNRQTEAPHTCTPPTSSAAPSHPCLCPEVTLASTTGMMRTGRVGLFCGVPLGPRKASAKARSRDGERAEAQGSGVAGHVHRGPGAQGAPCRAQDSRAQREACVHCRDVASTADTQQKRVRVPRTSSFWEQQVEPLASRQVWRGARSRNSHRSSNTQLRREGWKCISGDCT